MAGETVLVTDAGLACAVSAIRSLDRAGYRVVAADGRRWSAGMASRSAAASLVYPAPEKDPDGFVDCLDQAVNEHGIHLLLPVTDNAILPLNTDRRRFEGRCVLAMPNPKALAIAADKDQTRRDAEALDIPVPRTVLVRTAQEAEEAQSALGWPIVIKPRQAKNYTEGGIDMFTVTYAGNEQELRERMDELEGRCDVLLQEYCPGEGVGVELLLLDGEPLMAFQHERLREFPVHGGPGSLRKSAALDPDLYRYAVSLLASWKWTGLAMVEFKRGNGEARLMEVNGRIWGSMPLAAFSGLDFPTNYARMLLEGTRPGQSDVTYREGIRARNLAKDLMWILSVVSGEPRRRHPFLPAPRRMSAVQAALQLLHPGIRCDVQSWRDPAPGLLDLAHFGGSLWSKISRPKRRHAGFPGVSP